MGRLIWSMWGRYMAMSAALFMIDGALWSFIFSWPTFPSTGEALRFLYRPVSIPGATGLFMGLFTLLMEKPMISVPLGLKPFLYLATAGFCGLQFSCVIGAEFYAIAGLVYLRALLAGESSLPSDPSRQAAQMANRGKA